MAASDPALPAMHPGHYENFPVASLALPRRLRPPVRALYAFARAADDLADEGTAAPEERLAALDHFARQLDRIEAGEMPDKFFPDEPLFAALAGAVREYALPIEPLRDLLSAFRQDVTRTRHADFGEVMRYCRRSANPVGRLMLHLFGDHDPRHQALADGICSALQLINFLQDIALDWRKGRVYLPQDEMTRYGVSERQIAEGRTDPLWGLFMHHQVERARRMLRAGSPLGLALKGRIGLEMRLIILGGERILDKIDQARGDVFRHRPTLGIRDWAILLYRAVLPALRPRRRAKAGGCQGGGCQC